MDIDSLFFSALLKSKKPSYLRGVRREFFDGDWQKVFTFVRKFFSSHGTLPKITTVKSKFKNLSFKKALEPAAFYAGELRDRHTFGLIDDGLRTKYTERRSSGDLKGSVQALKDLILLSSRNTRQKDQGLLRINMGIEKRKKEYLARKKKKGLLGLPTPWKTLDSITQGWQPGDLIFLLARSGVGKSFWVILNALAACKKKKARVLLASREMYPGRLAIRFDGVGAGVSVDRYRKGKLLKKERLKMDKWYADLKTGHYGLVDIAGPNEISSPLDLELTINLGEYDFAIWDSFYLAAKKKEWAEFAQLVTDIKNVATGTHVPLVATSQFNKMVKKKHVEADTGATAFTDSIMHDADFLFALFQTPSMKILGEMLMRSLKVREGIELNELLLNWKIDEGNFSEKSHTIISDSYEKDPVIDDEEELTYNY